MPTMPWKAGAKVLRPVYAHKIDFGSPKIAGIQVWLNKELVGHLMIEMPANQREVRLDLEGGMMTFSLTKRGEMVDQLMVASDPGYLDAWKAKRCVPENADKQYRASMDETFYEWRVIGLGRTDQLACLFDHDKFEPV